MVRKSEKRRAEFEETYTNFFGPIFLFLASRLNDRERAKELAQETFMRTWMHIVQGKTIYLMRPFLYTTAYNLFKNELRRQKSPISLDALIDEKGFEIQDTGADTESQSLSRELFDHIEMLPSLQQKTLRLRYVEGWPVRKIADELNETPTAVSVRIHRAIKQLNTMYKNEKLD